jgi:hypothetical protein
MSASRRDFLRWSAMAVSSSSLQAIEPDGDVRPAIVSGSANVSQFIVGPTGNVYILFTGRVNLDDTTLPGTCLLAEVAPSTGVPTCVDDTLSWITWPQPHSGQNPAIQFDGAGAVYYSGHSSDGHTVLRKYVNGTVTDLITDNVSLYDFLVLPEGGMPTRARPRHGDERSARPGREVRARNEHLLGAIPRRQRVRRIGAVDVVDGLTLPACHEPTRPEALDQHLIVERWLGADGPDGVGRRVHAGLWGIVASWLP